MKLFFLLLALALFATFIYFEKNIFVAHKEVIPPTCIMWNDGCNTCFADNGKIFGCTKLYCETPSEPSCTKFAE